VFGERGGDTYAEQRDGVDVEEIGSPTARTSIWRGPTDVDLILVKQAGAGRCPSARSCHSDAGASVVKELLWRSPRLHHHLLS
jgi:hypothetical protein